MKEVKPKIRLAQDESGISNLEKIMKEHFKGEDNKFPYITKAIKEHNEGNK